MIPKNLKEAEARLMALELARIADQVDVVSARHIRQKCREAASMIVNLALLQEERQVADNALVDRYRDPKTGSFQFPTDVAAIVRRLDAAEAENASLQKHIASSASQLADAAGKARLALAGYLNPDQAAYELDLAMSAHTKGAGQ